MSVLLYLEFNPFLVKNRHESGVEFIFSLKVDVVLIREDVSDLHSHLVHEFFSKVVGSEPLGELFISCEVDSKSFLGRVASELIDADLLGVIIIVGAVVFMIAHPS